MSNEKTTTTELTDDELKALEILRAGKSIEDAVPETPSSPTPSGGIDTTLWLSDEVRNVTIATGIAGLLVGGGLALFLSRK